MSKTCDCNPCTCAPTCQCATPPTASAATTDCPCAGQPKACDCGPSCGCGASCGCAD